MSRAQGSKQRREPRFEDEEPSQPDAELRVSPEDRPGRSRRAANTKPAKAPPRRPRAAQPEPEEGERPRRRKGRGFFGTLIYWGFVLALWGGIALLCVAGYFAMKLPPIDQLTVPKRPPNVSILAADGSLIANRGETGGSNIPIGEMPAYLPKAFVAIEDHRFYSHFGVDPMGLGRALVKNIATRRTEQGGSTLTQQLAKNLFLTPERSLSRKAQEALLSLWLERNYTKDQILEL
ncbi:MAG: transglycosylase domain-containing protein, partial [Proteobacteria bacterium]|nr:transglycosylase domain-containing protein [Pseudomonadota bacterium]